MWLVAQVSVPRMPTHQAQWQELSTNLHTNNRGPNNNSSFHVRHQIRALEAIIRAQLPFSLKAEN